MRRLALALSALVCCAYTIGVAAEEQKQRPCKADMEKYCADARGDRTKMGDCMRQHFNDFSAACQARIKERQQTHGEHGSNDPSQSTAPAPGVHAPTSYVAQRGSLQPEQLPAVLAEDRAPS